MATAQWQVKAQDKKRRQQESIPKGWLIQPPSPDQLNVTAVPAECGLLSAVELEITETTDVDVLLHNLATAKWSSVQVTTAFYKRAIIAQQLTNCLTEIFVERALARAKDLDEQLSKTGKPVGPLHGLPISLKDQLKLKGLETTMGYVSWIGQIAEKDSVLVEVLYEAGAVPFVRTNIPQTLMWPETFNNIFGRTVNPYNRTLTSGGSSGGEGALVALKGSPLGVGSDIGGSIRIPSNFCGLYGLRPSSGRVPYEGAANSMEGQDSVVSVLGPMSNSITAVKAFMKAVIGTSPWDKDPWVIRKAWDEEAYKLSEHGGGKDLVFAIIWDDETVKPHPPIIRALEQVKQALIADGHKVVDWVPYKHQEIVERTSNIWGAGNNDDFKAVIELSGEPLITTMSPDESIAGPTEFKVFGTSKTSYELWQVQKEKLRLRKEYLDHWIDTKNQTGTGRPVDAVISPVAPFAAPPHGKNSNAAYTTVWNALDYPACVFPVTFVDPAIDQQKPPHAFKNEKDKQIYELYDPGVFKGAPVGLQVVGRRLEDEAVIALTEIVDRALKNSKQAQKLKKSV